MKKLLIIVGVCITHLSFSQINNFKNSFGININAINRNFGNYDYFSQSNISYQYERFYKPNRSFEVGMNVNTVTKNGNSFSNVPLYYSKSIGFDVALKRYTAITQIKGLYFSVKTGLAYNKGFIDYNLSTYSINNLNAYIEPGLTYFIKPRIALELNYHVNLMNISSTGLNIPNLNQNSFGVGVKYYFGKANKN